MNNAYNNLVNQQLQLINYLTNCRVYNKRNYQSLENCIPFIVYKMDYYFTEICNTVEKFHYQTARADSWYTHLRMEGQEFVMHACIYAFRSWIIVYTINHSRYTNSRTYICIYTLYDKEKKEIFFILFFFGIAHFAYSFPRVNWTRVKLMTTDYI